MPWWEDPRTHSSWGSGPPGGYHRAEGTWGHIGANRAGYNQRVNDWNDGFNGDPWRSWDQGTYEGWDPRTHNRNFYNRDYADEYHRSASARHAVELPGQQLHPRTAPTGDVWRYLGNPGFGGQDRAAGRYRV